MTLMRFGNHETKLVRLPTKIRFNCQRTESLAKYIDGG